MSRPHTVLRLLMVLALALAGACGRPLDPAEQKFLAEFHGGGLDYSRIRVSGGFEPFPHRYTVPPRTTCQQKLFPPVKTRTVLGAAPAMTLFNVILVRDDWYAPNLTGDYPDVLNLAEALMLLHESIHVWQWQHRTTTQYSPVKAALEHFGSTDPYLFDPATKADFASFGYEQQGSIAEEYLCCRLLAPDAERTQRLHRMLSQALPLTPLSTPIAKDVLLPWKGVELKHICD